MPAGSAVRAAITPLENNTKDNDTMNTQQVTVTMTKTKDCKGSVRFDAAKTTPPQPLENVYVSRIMPGINEAQEITVTIFIAKP